MQAWGSPDKDASRVAPDKDANRVAPDKDANRVAPDKGANRVAPDKDANRVDPDKDANRVAPDKDANRVAPDKDANRVAPDKDANRVAPDKDANRVAPDKDANRVARATANRILTSISLMSLSRDCVSTNAHAVITSYTPQNICKNHHEVYFSQYGQYGLFFRITKLWLSSTFKHNISSCIKVLSKLKLRQ
jgi:hypothetical protein